MWVMCGYDNLGSPCNDVYRYNVHTRVWATITTPAEQRPSHRHSHVAFAINRSELRAPIATSHTITTASGALLSRGGATSSSSSSIPAAPLLNELEPGAPSTVIETKEVKSTSTTTSSSSSTTGEGIADDWSIVIVGGLAGNGSALNDVYSYNIADNRYI
jgi:hypothetical protein